MFSSSYSPCPGKRTARGRAASSSNLHWCGPQSPLSRCATSPMGVAASVSACAAPLSTSSYTPLASPHSLPLAQRSPRAVASASHRVERLQSQAGKPGAAAGLEAALSAAKKNGKTALVIWFHFLGGSGSDWEKSLKTKLADELPWVEWYFPDAPNRPITNYDGQVARGWFDMLEGRVTETMETPGLEDSVASVHSMLRQAEASGIPASRILLGGMSQGGVLAMKAGLSYERPLAGIAAFSAWVPSSLPQGIRHPRTPLLIGCGDRDEVVPIEICRRGIELLTRAGCVHISKKQYPGLAHTWASYEREDAKNFIASALPRIQGAQDKLASAASHANLPLANVATPLRLRRRCLN